VTDGLGGREGTAAGRLYYAGNLALGAGTLPMIGGTIPRAVLISVLAIAGFYVIGSFAQVAGYHFNLSALGKNVGAPLFGLAGPTSAGGFSSVGIR
jgi:amino acid transporter